MSGRKITSLTLLLSFLVLVLTSIVLYVVPEGRVAYWSDWRWLGLGKKQWGDIHINAGFLFLAAGCVHLWYNWKPVVAYLSATATARPIVTPALIAALALNLAVLAGTLLNLPPFSSILAFGHWFKEAAAIKHGEPPYGHAELSSLALLAKRTGLDPAEADANLNRAGIRFADPEQSLLAIARNNSTTPKVVFEAMQSPASNTVSMQPFPDQPFPGMGRMTLAELCRHYGLDQQRIVAHLTGTGMSVDPNKSLKEIAAANNTDPHALFGLIHAAAHRP